MSTLAERDSELAEISSFVRRVAGGEAAGILFEGPAGIGKTSLLQKAQEAFRLSSGVVLEAVGAELEQGLPFAVVRQLFADVVAGEPVDSPLFSGAARLAGLALELGIDGTASGDGLHAAFHGLHWLAAGLADRAPLLLSIDDLQWADGESLRWFDYLLRRIGGLPIGIVATLRTGDAGSRETALGAIRRQPAMHVLRPSPLTPAATASTIRAQGVPASDALCETVHELCGGNPFLLEQVVNSIRAEGAALDDDAAAKLARLVSDEVAQAVLLRVARNSPPAVEFTRAVAVLGPSATVARAAALAQIDSAAVAPLVESLIESDVLSAGLPLRFRHPLVQQSVYADLPPATRAARHRAAAVILMDDAAADDDVVAQLLLSEPTQDPRAAVVLRRAARRALGNGSPVGAASLLERALHEPLGSTAAEVLYELGQAETMSGTPTAVSRLSEALELTTDPAARADVITALARAHNVTGDTRRALALLSEERERLRDTTHPDEGLGQIAAEWATLMLQAGIPSERVFLECRDLVEVVNPAARQALSVVLAHTAPEREERLRWGQQAWAHGRLLEAIPLESMLPIVLAAGLVQDGELAFAAEIAEASFAAAQRHGSALGTAMALGVRAETNGYRGRLLDAEADATIVLDLTEQGGWALGTQSVLITLARVLIERGELALAEERLAQAPATAEPIYCGVLTTRAELRVRQSRFPEALADAQAAGALLGQSGANQVFRHDFVLATALAGLGQHEAARTLATERLAVVRRLGIPLAVADGVVALASTAESPAALDAWRDAVDSLEQLPFPVHLARALVQLGASMRRNRLVTESREVLLRGHELALRCHAAGLAAQAADELAAAGARPRSGAQLGVGALSPRERRVCQLAVEGLSNTRIAQTLFVSVKTVETQLSSAYRKLGISRRHELAAAMADD